MLGLSPVILAFRAAIRSEPRTQGTNDHRDPIRGRRGHGCCYASGWKEPRQTLGLQHAPLGAAAIFGSGGTTGQLKGVVHSHLT